MMFFYFLKIIFNISTSKQFKKYKLHLNLIKKLKFNKIQVETQANQPLWITMFRVAIIQAQSAAVRSKNGINGQLCGSRSLCLAIYRWMGAPMFMETNLLLLVF